MPARTLNRVSYANLLRVTVRLRPAYAALWLAGLLLAGTLGGFAKGQASQGSGSSQANAAQQGAQQDAKPAAQQPSSGPMVMGENPDSPQDAGTAPAQPAKKAAQVPPAKARPGTLVLWNPANPPGETPSAAQPPAAAAAVAAPSGALPLPPPADAGGDVARQQINNECVYLLKMANELKAAVDKSNKNMLSVAVVRKANEIESLAHQVKDEMKPEVGKN